MKKRYPAEFERQSFVQLIFPHEKTDWIEYLEEARECIVTIANSVIQYQKCLIICHDIDVVKTYFTPHKNLLFTQYETDDTWARDCSAITIVEGKKVKLLNFTFNGWGGKFHAKKDNLMTQHIPYNNDILSIHHELEGGALESNGQGLLLTTSQCLLNKNRTRKTRQQLEEDLHHYFGIHKVLWLDSGYLAGDDTDSHIDTLARFINHNTIMYVQCNNKHDEHYQALQRMQQELEAFAKSENLKLIALPMCEPIYYDGERLPATYANFLIINNAVLVPTYNSIHDNEAVALFAKSFPEHTIVPIDCSVLIRQHGSLHCVTMNFFEGVTFNL